MLPKWKQRKYILVLLFWVLSLYDVNEREVWSISDEDMSMKAVKRLGKSCKNLFKMDNARVLLLEMAKDYLNHSQLEEDTDKQYGKGVTKYIGSAIYRYYGVENLE